MGERVEQQDQALEIIAESHASAPEVPYQYCLLEEPSDPCTIVIFGASGDLTSRKLMPALYNLHLHQGLPRALAIVGCGRTAMDRQVFRDKMKEALQARGQADLSGWDEFASRLYYYPMSYDSLDSFKGLSRFLRRVDQEQGTGGNKIFYLAVPPSLYQVISLMLGRSGLAAEGKGGRGWSRLVVEKPYGRDLESARQLNRAVRLSFEEHQIFRIDHYLAKETVQNVLMFRFANSIFEPIWNRSYIDHVDIIAAETLGVENRAAYYEQAGVLRDMFQNHMMQLLALTAMEPPSLCQADRVRDEKCKVFRCLRPFPVENLDQNLVLGQYLAGEIEGRKVPGYRQEPGVDPKSLTPTFAMMRVFIDNWRWQGVPFYLTSGKRLARKLTEIVIQFKEVPHSVFRNVLGEHIMPNVLTLGIQPDEKITLKFQTKSPGARMCLRSVTMDFNYLQGYQGPVLDAYEKALLDCMQGDHMLFWRQDGVEQCWAFLAPVLEECETCPDRKSRLHFYEAGSWGPAAAMELKKNHKKV